MDILLIAGLWLGHRTSPASLATPASAGNWIDALVALTAQERDLVVDCYAGEPGHVEHEQGKQWSEELDGVHG